MFTGIIETTGKVIGLKKEKGNLILTIGASFTGELIKGQSIAHNGACLTVETIDKKKKQYTVTAVAETLQKTNLGNLKAGDVINLERSLKIGDRLDGHFVQGHVDTTATIGSIIHNKGSWTVALQISGLKSQISNLIIDKGSITINGVSLTVVEVSPSGFSVAIIPHTFKHTNFSSLKKGDAVNIEFDILGKYISKIITSKD